MKYEIFLTVQSLLFISFVIYFCKNFLFEINSF
jgi:hypothetical protein